jgi:uncharacterized membrane protein
MANEIFNLMNASTDFLLGGTLGALTAGLIITIAFLALGGYIYHALAWQKIGKNQKYEKPWLAWIPFANVSMILQMGGFNWAWVFLFLVPILGWITIMVLMTIAMWRIFQKSKYPEWLSISYPLSGVSAFFLTAYLVVIGLIAWKDFDELVSKKIAKKKASKKK